MSLSAFALFLLALAGPAWADGAVLSKMTKEDAARLENYEATRAKALAGSPQNLRNASLEGNWRCRTIKLGGMEPKLVVYGWFKCRLHSDDAGLWLDKTTGSQRTRGLFYDDGDTRMIYLGKLHYGYEQPGLYGADPARNQIAYAFLVDKNRMRLEFPAPQYESLLDVMELERQ